MNGWKFTKVCVLNVALLETMFTLKQKYALYKLVFILKWMKCISETNINH